MELVENETLQEKKEFAKEHGSAIATTLRLAKPYFNSGITLCADCWFGFPKCRGNWASATRTLNGVKLLGVTWKNKTNKQLLSICATDEMADARRVLRDRVITRPKIAEEYFVNTAGIDVRNYVRLGGKVGGWEDLFTTHKAWHKHFSGLIGMSETNAYLAYTFFNRLNLAQQFVTNSIGVDTEAEEANIQDVCVQLVNNGINIGVHDLLM
eukprot:Pgem_evm3s4813